MNTLENQIENIALRLPKLPPKPIKNFFDILGIRNKETINSKIIAYFLDSEEEHGLKSLFFDSLIEILKEKSVNKPKEFFDTFSGKHKVILEDTTSYAVNYSEKQKRIDITITGDDWCIIIENKLYHKLINPLKAYWQHAEKKYSKNLIGIVLSLDVKSYKECKVNDKIIFINITHQEWIAKIQSNLVLGEILGETNLLYLREYIKTINTHYQQKMDEPKMNNVINALVRQSGHVKEIQHKLNESITFIEHQIEEVFKSFGYKKVNHWYTHRGKPHQLYFYITPAEDIIMKNKFEFYYEVRNETNELYRDLIKKDVFKNTFENINYTNIKISGNIVKKPQTHLAIYIESNFFGKKETFKETLTKILEDNFMGSDGIVEKSIAFLDNKLGSNTNSIHKAK